MARPLPLILMLMIPVWIGDPGVTLVIGSPKNVTISISSPGDIVEGNSVTLTCRSDADPPGEISWFRGKEFLQHGETYSISWISSDNRGEYKCQSKNQHGEKFAVPVTLNVMYPPRNVEVHQSSLSGDIAEGSSVTLTCSNDANPPAEISWFKGTTFLKVGKTYSIGGIRSNQSGEYKCEAENKHGMEVSGPMTLKVIHPNSPLSISGKVEHDSVTLICSSDSNPPAHSYTWFKENETSPVGSGQRFSALQSGWFYCMAQNEHQLQKSAAIAVIVKSSSVFLYVAVAVGLCGASAALIVVLYIRQRTNRKSAENVPSVENIDDHTYTALDRSRSSADLYNTLTIVHTS